MCIIQGPVVQSIISLANSLVVKTLIVLENAKATHIFSAKIVAYMPYLMVKVLTIHLLTPSLVLNNWALRTLRRNIL